MKAHELARQLLEQDNHEMMFSLDVSTNEGNMSERVHGSEFFGVTLSRGITNHIMLLIGEDTAKTQIKCLGD